MYKEDSIPQDSIPQFTIDTEDVRYSGYEPISDPAIRALIVTHQMTHDDLYNPTQRIVVSLGPIRGNEEAYLRESVLYQHFCLVINSTDDPSREILKSSGLAFAFANLMRAGKLSQSHFVDLIVRLIAGKDVKKVDQILAKFGVKSLS